jgi:hypothetical protein
MPTSSYAEVATLNNNHAGLISEEDAKSDSPHGELPTNGDHEDGFSYRGDNFFNVVNQSQNEEVNNGFGVDLPDLAITGKYRIQSGENSFSHPEEELKEEI